MVSAERAFHKSLAALRRLQQDRGFVPQIGFVSQNTDQPENGFVFQNTGGPEIGFVPQNTADPETGFVSQNDQSAQTEAA